MTLFLRDMETLTETDFNKSSIDVSILLRAYELMCCVKHMARTYDENRQICKYVHSTSRGHEAIQLALRFQLNPTTIARLITVTKACCSASAASRMN